MSSALVEVPNRLSSVVYLSHTLTWGIHVGHWPRPSANLPTSLDVRMLAPNLAHESKWKITNAIRFCGSLAIHKWPHNVFSTLVFHYRLNLVQGEGIAPAIAGRDAILAQGYLRNSSTISAFAGWLCDGPWAVKRPTRNELRPLHSFLLPVLILIPILPSARMCKWPVGCDFWHLWQGKILPEHGHNGSHSTNL